LASGPVIEVLSKTARDNARTPMQWSSAENAGFSRVKPWMPVAEHGPEITVSNQLENEDSILHFYRKLIRLRREHPVIASGEPVMIDTGDTQTMAYLRRSDSQTLLVVANLSSSRYRMPESLVPLIHGKPEPIIQSIEIDNWDFLESWQAFAIYIDHESGGEN
jgi:glycosidase